MGKVRFAAILLLPFMAGCSLFLSIDISPATAETEPGGTIQFHANVSGGTSLVLWSVVEGADGGSVSAAGLYTAPMTAGTFHVRAACADDHKKTAVSMVTVAVPDVILSITPASVVAFAGYTCQFTAALAGSSNAAVTWAVVEGASGGSISASGLYTAPAAYGTYHVTATSVVNPAASATATVKVYILSQHTGTIATSATWAGTGTVHVLTDDILIEGNATVTVESGATVFMNGKFSISIGKNSPGALVAVGTAEQPIVFTSIASSPAPGDWYGIRFYPNILPATKLQYCTIEYAGGATTYPGSLHVRDCAVPVSDCTIRRSLTAGIDYVGTGHVTGFANNTVKDGLSYPIVVLAQYLPEIGTGNAFSGNMSGTVPVDGVAIEGGTVTASATWRNLGYPYFVTGDISMGDNANQPVVTVEAGTHFRVAKDFCIRTGYGSAAAKGGLVAVGMPGSPIVFTSAAATPAAGDWDGLRFYADTLSATTMRYCTIEYAGGNGTYPGSLHIRDCAVPVSDCTIRWSQTAGIDYVGTGHASGLSGCTITDGLSYPIVVPAQYLPEVGTGNAFSGNRSGTVPVDGVAIEGGTVTASATWRNLGFPYFVTGDISLGDNANQPVVTLEAGTQFRVAQDFCIRTGYGSAAAKGGLVAVGTAGSPIVFTSAAASPAAGNWDGLRFYADTLPVTSLRYCTIEYAGGNTTYPGSLHIRDCAVPVSDCAIRWSLTAGVDYVGTGRVTGFTNNTIAYGSSYAMVVSVGNVSTVSTGNTFTGNSLNGIAVDGGTMVMGDIWQNLGVPFYILGDISIENATWNPVLTIQPGTVIKVAAGKYIRTGYNATGGLYAVGTATEPITFTGAAAAPAAGDWYGLRFHQYTKSGTTLQYCTVEYGGGSGTYQGNIYIKDTTYVTISNCTIRNSENYGIYMTGTHPSSGLLSLANTFQNTPSGAVYP